MTLVVTSTGPQCSVQDLGRAGFAALGVGRSGAFDRTALRRANRLVGNDETDAGLEVLLGGLVLRAQRPVVVAVTGPGPVLVDDQASAPETTIVLPPGRTLTVGAGGGAALRRYIAVRGGVHVAEVLGSRATDTLTGLGPPPVTAGDVLAAGEPFHPVPDVDQIPLAPVDPDDEVSELDAVAGPRLDRLTAEVARTLTTATWRIDADSDRVGVRLDGPALHTTVDGSLPSEGMRPGSIEIPPDGRPVVFGPDHPVTGGYPVAAVLTAAALDRLAQLGPGRRLRLRLAPVPSWCDLDRSRRM